MLPTARGGGPRAFAPPDLPAGLEALAALALDLRWTWCHQADHLWRRIDPVIWEKTRNPWLVLQEVPRARLAELAGDLAFRNELSALLEARQRYLTSSPAAAGPDTGLVRRVAYFSMEYGLGAAIPLYAGGLGVLAGDHLEAASDLGVPIVAVGLLYQEGYFRQAIDVAGRQQELYPYNDPTTMPIQPVLADSGAWLMIPIDLPGRTVSLRVWLATVGRVPLYLLDTNVPVNEPADRGITCKLYGDGPETRIQQEIVLGIGGWRLIEALDLDPGACHLNEGHAAFAVLERARLEMRRHGLSFHEALAATRGGNVFTTHTSVAAGIDAFPTSLVAKYFPEGRGYLAELGISLGELLALGQHPEAGPNETFRPAYLAIRGAARVNAVSALAGRTSRRLFRCLFPRWPVSEIPITHVTNGVHVPSWDSAVSDDLWTTACGPERWRTSVEGHEPVMAAIDDHTLWSVRGRARAELVGRIRDRLAHQLARRGETPEAIDEASRRFDPDVLTMVIARRFAEYKRPNLLLRDPERLRRILTDTRRPVQIVVAGKAHPDDGDGKSLIEAWVRFAAEPAVRGRCVFLEDYDLTLAQELVQGADLWINTPRRPWEACGTSGMKVLVNGGLNLSVLDGWWAEAYEPEVGWAVSGNLPAGAERFEAPSDDANDAAALFDRLEHEVVPAFYDRDGEGLPRAWLRKVRASLSRLTPRFSANRMLNDYVTRFYRPAEIDLARRTSEKGAGGRQIRDWARRLETQWQALRFGRLDVHPLAQAWEVNVEVFLNEIAPNDVAVQLYAEPRGEDDQSVTPLSATGTIAGTSHGHLYRASVPADRPPGDYTVRIVPASPLAAVPLELPLIAWQR